VNTRGKVTVHEDTHLGGGEGGARSPTWGGRGVKLVSGDGCAHTGEDGGTCVV